MGLCRFIPRENLFSLEESSIPDCDVFLEWNEHPTQNGQCFGFNLAKGCFISFTLEKALQKHLTNNPGNIQRKLKYLNLTNPILFNGIYDPKKKQTQGPIAVSF